MVTGTMKAWRTYGTGDMRLDEIPIPETRDGYALIKVRTLQPSITEVERLNRPGAKKDGEPVQWFGHEFCGEVVEVGKGVSNVKPGDRVFWWRPEPCHNCALCKAGDEELCCKGPLMGTHIPGCLAEYVALPAVSISSIPDSISDSEAAAMQPLVGVVANVYNVGIEMGDNVVVLGQGTMGLNVTQVSRVCGAAKVIAVDIREDALAFAERVGATLTINATKTDPVAAVLEATSGLGADVVFECAGGSPKAGLAGTQGLSQAVRMVRDQGKVQQIALLDPDATTEVTPINMRGIRYQGLFVPALRRHASYSIELVASKRVDLAPLVTQVLQGLEKVPEAFEITGNKAKYQAVSPAQVVVSR